MSYGPPKGNTVGCNRRAARYHLPHSEAAWIDLRAPDGSQWKLPLLEISATGLAFGAEPGFPELPRGTDLPGVELQVGRASIRGDLRLEHRTSGISTGTVCGASFRPGTEADRAELLQLIEVLGSLHVPKL